MMNAAIKIHGLKKCDTCRKAVKDLAAADIAHQFFDFRKDGLAESDLKKWVASAGWQVLLNPRGTTWRGLSEAKKADMGESKATALMLEHPALIKRPVFEIDEKIAIGYKDEQKIALGL